MQAGGVGITMLGMAGAVLMGEVGDERAVRRVRSKKKEGSLRMLFGFIVR